MAGKLIKARKRFSAARPQLAYSAARPPAPNSTETSTWDQVTKWSLSLKVHPPPSKKRQQQKERKVICDVSVAAPSS